MPGNGNNNPNVGDINADLQISFDPSELRQEVKFGADAKLSLKGYAEGNTDQVSQRMFDEMDLTMFRIPIYAMRQADDPFYENLVKVMKSAKAVNPDIKFFASVANGDGDENNNLHNADKFPPSMMGCCPNNVYNLNLTAYARRIDQYLQMLEDNDLYVDYLGPFNEDPASSEDYRRVFVQMEKLGDIKRVGLETWALQAGINRVESVQDQLDIVGSHIYDDDNIPKSQWDAKWAELVQKSTRPVWHTEATRYRTNDNITNLVDGMANIIPAIRGGVEYVHFYQTTRRIVYFNGGVQPYKFSGFKALVNSATGKHVASSNSTDVDVMSTVFVDDEVASLHIINTSEMEKTASLKIEGGYYSLKPVRETLWDEDNLETTTERSLGQRKSPNEWNVVLPANSYMHIEIPLKD
ncbi:MAG: hypothetical protein EA341_03370 [Mongoliibacter sp.]|nr:MAG: hypothetical protein EA341_03370 [Mongoliibacter sp.]